MTLPVDTPRQRHRHVPAAPMTTVHDSIAALVEQEGWRAEGDAARVHYDGGGDRFAVEFYANAERVLYWTVPSANPMRPPPQPPLFPASRSPTRSGGASARTSTPPASTPTWSVARSDLASGLATSLSPPVPSPFVSLYPLITRSSARYRRFPPICFGSKETYLPHDTIWNDNE